MLLHVVCAWMAGAHVTRGGVKIFPLGNARFAITYLYPWMEVILVEVVESHSLLGPSTVLQWCGAGVYVGVWKVSEFTWVGLICF